MEKIFILLLLVALVSCSTAHGFVKLSGNQNVKRFSNVRLNCSSNSRPFANTASIQVDGKSYTAITLQNGNCFSSVLGKYCTPNVCECSNRGLWYSHTHKVAQHIGVVNFTCLMTFEGYGSFTDSITVKIIDFIGPTITTEPRLPFSPGINVTFTCTVETSSTNITFEWECLGKLHVEPQSRSGVSSYLTQYSSDIMRNIYLIHDGETCRCRIYVDGVLGSSEISLAFRRKPTIDISKAETCESSSTITVYCEIRTGFPLFGFKTWIHTKHGAIIRHLEGERNHTKSLLKFDSCSHGDTGDYTCKAYNDYGGNKTFANKTVSLLVYGPPIIKSAEDLTCNNSLSSVTLSCNINTGLPVYGFNQWLHYFNGTFIRSLNGSVKEMTSILEVETCSYQNAGEYMCVAWNKYKNTTLVANRTIVLIVNDSPIIISSGVIREQQTVLSVTFYSSTAVLLTWQQSNLTLTNLTERVQTLDRKKIELIIYNRSIECDGYTANLSIRSYFVGEYVLRIQNTVGETRLFFDVNELVTQGPPIIKSEEDVTCNNSLSSVTLSCNINTGLPVYGFNQWLHYFNGTFIRSLNGSVKEMTSILEVETCSYQNAGEYMCVAWNKYKNTTLVANRTIVLIVNDSPVIVSSGVIREQQTVLSVTFYSSTAVLLTWQQSNLTLTNSTERVQTLDRKKIELIIYNRSIECDGYTASLSIRSYFVGEYVLRIQNTVGETRLFFDVNELVTQGGDVPLSPSYGVDISQLVRFARVCNNVLYISERNLCITENYYTMVFDIKTSKQLLNFIIGPPIIKSEGTVTCNSSSVTLSCNINTGLPVYGFDPWLHYFNGTFVRSLNGSVQEMKSILQIETCSYQNAGEYMCVAWNKYGDKALIANKTIVLVVNASPVIISSGIIQERQTILFATFYSSTEVFLTWQQSNQTITNSTERVQTVDRKKMHLLLYNKSIECDGYIANLSISEVGEYVLLIQNTFGEIKQFFDVKELTTQEMIAPFDLRTVMFCIIAIGIFILSSAGTVLLSKGIRRKNVIHIIGPHERCPKVPIYHTAPAINTTPNVYAIPETGYLQVTNEEYGLDHVQDTENKGGENYSSSYMSSNYDEIDI